MRFSSREMEILFDYLDTDGGGSIGYQEFTRLLDEKRRGIDPFSGMGNQQDEMEVFEKRNKLFDAENYRGKNSNMVSDNKIDIANCTSQKLANFKFRKMQQKFAPERMY